MSDYLLRGLSEIKRALTLNARELSNTDRQYFIQVLNEVYTILDTRADGGED